MNNYICKYQLVHDKPVGTDLEPSSNNGWIYTAYMATLHGWTREYKRNTYHDLYFKCLNPIPHSEYPFMRMRLPAMKYPPISRDEIIGMISLGVLDPYALRLVNWLFYLPSIYRPKNIIQVFKGLKRLKGKHRNYVWKEQVVAAYPVAFRLWYHDRYWAKKTRGYSTTLFEWFAFNMNALLTILGNNTSVKNILWLQLTELNSKYWIMFINQEKNFIKYFGEEHVINN